MKKKTLCILAALAFAGCTYDDRQAYNPEERLMFQPGMYMHMSHDGVECFSRDMTFAVKAWSLPLGCGWNDMSGSAIEFLPLSTAHCCETVITDTLIEESRNDLLWMVDEEVMWPPHDETLAFMAYSPANAACECDPEKGVTYSTDITEEQVDLLYSLPCSDRNKVEHGWIVPLRFCHSLCRMDFRVKNRVAKDEKITVKNITVDAVKNKGRFTSLPSPKWQLGSSLVPLCIFDGSEEVEQEPQKIGRYWFVPPQTLETEITVEYEYTTREQTSITQRLKTVPVNTTLKPGLTYTYTLSIGIDDVRFLQEVFED